MAGFVLGHLVDGVVDGVVAEFLCQLRQLELARRGAVFGGDAHGEVFRGVGFEKFAEGDTMSVTLRGDLINVYAAEGGASLMKGVAAR